MTAHVASQPSPEPAPAAITPLLRTVLLCDLVESTALVERLGDSRVAQLLQRHDQLLVRRLAEHNGQLIDKSDGVLALFERPIQALAFAMDYQRDLRELGQSAGETLQARIGIHVGDVMTWTHTPAEVLAGAKPVEVEGLAKPVAARLMGLALPGQILLSGMAQNFAQRAQAELGERAGRLHWRFHGRYRFKGVPAPMLVHEAGETGLAPLKPPPSGAKAWRELPFWRKPPVLAIEALLLVGLASFGIYSAVRSPPAIAFAERDWVVVADFNNRTGETLYDDALDSALRVGLEQSRYVNVLSDLQVEQALQRMQRTAQTLDRQTGSELALREGAKALVLPTIAEVGGRPRVSVEVVDPNSGVTVYTRMADASGSGGVVAALDDVITEMRADLGESLTSIQKNNVPLEKATTENLEALRAFSLGIRARFDGRSADAMQLFQSAVELDSEFSMAYLRMAGIAESNDLSKAHEYLNLAARYRQRLTLRESLFLDASLALFDLPAEMLRRWKLLSDMYPDEYRAYYNYSYFYYVDLQRYAEAIDHLVPALVETSQFRASSLYLKGALQLSSDKIDDALETFRNAEIGGVSGYMRDFSDAYAAKRDFESASSRMAKHVTEGLSGATVEDVIYRVTYALDRGAIGEALIQAESIKREFSNSPSGQQDAVNVLLLALRSYASADALDADLSAYIVQGLKKLPRGTWREVRDDQYHLLCAAWIAARIGKIDLAEKVLTAVEQDVMASGAVANTDWLSIVRAEIMLSNGVAHDAIEILETRAEQDDASYFVRSVLARAYLTAGKYNRALAAAQWLLSHRGRAYGEVGSDWLWQPFRVLESDLALLTAAESAAQMGNKKLALELNNRFRELWPGAENHVLVTRRQRLLQHAD